MMAQKWTVFAPISFWRCEMIFFMIRLFFKDIAFNGEFSHHFPLNIFLSSVGKMARPRQRSENNHQRNTNLNVVDTFVSFILCPPAQWLKMINEIIGRCFYGSITLYHIHFFQHFKEVGWGTFPGGWDH